MDEHDSQDVTRPTHYTGTTVCVHSAYQTGGRIYAEVECMEVILALDLPYPLDNVFKYIWRNGKKAKNPTLKDLMKAQFYLNRIIEELQWKEAHAKKQQEG